MSAGTQYSKQLNMDLNYVRTPAFYDTNNDEWLMGAAQFVKNASGLWVPVSETNPMPAKLTGSKMELYGASLDDRPDATTVPIGATFTIVDASQEFRSWISDGTDWLEV